MDIIKTDSGEIKLSPEIVRKFLVRGNGNITPQECTMFLALCKFQKLNPFLNEVYLLKFGEKPSTMVVGKEVFTKRAFANPNFKGFKAGVTIETAEGELKQVEGTVISSNQQLIGGWCETELTSGFKFFYSASLEEYDKGHSSWRTMKATMIRKVAIVGCLREAFPSLFQAMYSSEEMPTDEKIEMELERKIVIPQTENTAKSNVHDSLIKLLNQECKDHGINEEEKETFIKELFAEKKESELSATEFAKLLTEIRKMPILSQMIIDNDDADNIIHAKNVYEEPNNIF